MSHPLIWKNLQCLEYSGCFIVLFTLVIAPGVLLMPFHCVLINGSHVPWTYLEFYFQGVLFLNPAYYFWLFRVIRLLFVSQLNWFWYSVTCNSKSHEERNILFLTFSCYCYLLPHRITTCIMCFFIPLCLKSSL